jgi:stage V sporulation protein AC
VKLNPKQYDEMIGRASPPSPVVRDCVWAFCVGGAICTVGEGLRQLFLIWYDKALAGTLTSIALIFLSALFTLPGKPFRATQNFIAIPEHYGVISYN